MCNSFAQVTLCFFTCSGVYQSVSVEDDHILMIIDCFFQAAVPLLKELLESETEVRRI